MKFMELLANKQVLPKDVESAIDRWNDDMSPESLPDYLGLTNEEFAIFAEHQANERYEASYSFLESLAKLIPTFNSIDPKTAYVRPDIKSSK